MTDTVSVSANCPCGAKVTWPDNAKDDTPLVCKECGADLGTYGAFKVKAISAVKDKVGDIFKSVFKRN